MSVNYKFENQLGKLLVQDNEDGIELFVKFYTKSGIYYIHGNVFPFTIRKDSTIITNITSNNFDKMDSIYHMIDIDVNYQENSNNYKIRYEFTLSLGLQCISYINNEGVYHSGPRGNFSYIEKDPDTEIAQVYKEYENGEYDIKLIELSQGSHHISEGDFIQYMDACVNKHIHPYDILSLQRATNLLKQDIIDIICDNKALIEKYDDVSSQNKYDDIISLEGWIQEATSRKDICTCETEVNNDSTNTVTTVIENIPPQPQVELNNTSTSRNEKSSNSDDTNDTDNNNKRDREEICIIKKVKNIKKMKRVMMETCKSTEVYQPYSNNYIITDKITIKNKIKKFKSKDIIFSVRKDSFCLVDVHAFHSQYGFRKGNGIIFDRFKGCFKRCFFYDNKNLRVLGDIENADVINEYFNNYIITDID